MIKTAIKLFCVFFLYISLTSCSEEASEVVPCSITVDSVSIIDSIQVSDKSYYLVYRVSGWNDKTEILELYDLKPEFDHCSKSNIEPLYGDSLELTQAVSHVYLNIKDKVLDIEYKEPSDEVIDNSDLKLELK